MAKKKARFVKGSAAAKRFMAKLRRMKKSSKKKSKKHIHKKSKIKRRFAMARRKRKAKYRVKSRGNVLIGQAFAAGVYGASRGYLSQMLAPVVAKIPGGIYADNIVLGGVSYFLARYGKIPLVKKIGKAGMIVEAAMLGEDIVSKRASGTTF